MELFATQEDRLLISFKLIINSSHLSVQDERLFQGRRYRLKLQEDRSLGFDPPLLRKVSFWLKTQPETGSRSFFHTMFIFFVVVGYQPVLHLDPNCYPACSFSFGSKINFLLDRKRIFFFSFLKEKK